MGRNGMTPGFLAALAWLLWQQESLVLPLLTAAALHECAHVLSALALGVSVSGISLTAVGAKLTIDHRCRPAQEALVLAAGPAMNLLWGRFLWPGVWSEVHVLLAVFNLLPVPPLDGGQLSRLVWEDLFPGRPGWMIWHALAYGCCTGLTLLGLLAAVHGNPALLALAGWLWMEMTV